MICNEIWLARAYDDLNMNTRLFFATDLHGSERCFLKFVNAARVYKAQVLILGGDITGKMIIPILKNPTGSYTSTFSNVKYEIRTEQELDQLQEKIRISGYYPYVATPEEYDELNRDKRKLDELFSEIMYQTVKKWINVAEERLKNANVQCFITPGNDDRLSIDKAFENSEFIINPEDNVVSLMSGNEMISSGYSNTTPFNSPREISEEELEQKIERMASNVKSMKSCIFNFHCPPANTPLDQAPKLKNLKPETSIGGPITIAAGSIAVRKAINKYQPLLGLHGHIHESRGTVRIGRTLCINPGSEYTEGILRGIIINIDGGKLNYLLTSG